MLKGICARYKARWGDDAFVPERKQPYTTAHAVAIVTILDDGHTSLPWSTVLRQAMLVAFCRAQQSWFMIRTQRPVSVNSQVRPTCAWFQLSLTDHGPRRRLADGPLWGAFGGVVVEPDVDRKRSGDGNVL